MKVFHLFVVSLLIGAATVMAQSEPEKTQAETKKAKSEGKDVSQAEREIAAIKLAECRSEVDLAKFAAEHSKNEQVQKFAAMMVKDHQEACKALEKWAGVSDHSTTKSEDAKSAGEETRRNQSGKALNWVAMHQEMTQRCLAAAKKELGEKDGAEFDKCFMAMQIVGHQKTIIADEVFVNYVSSENRELIEKCRETATAHLQAAKAICNELDRKSVTTTARSK